MYAKYIVPPKVVRDFAKVRAAVQRAVDASPRSVTLEDALKQVQSFQSETPKK
jgi:hypothetical protein